jgi:siroheme decarboxylase
MPEPSTMDPHERALLHEIENGLPLVSRPYAEVAQRIGSSEAWVTDTLQRLVREGIIKRVGVVVRHRELGYHANAMVVWDVPDADVAGIGRRFGDASYVTLCYRRPRRPPDWPYNLFTMIHGRDRGHVLAQVDRLISLAPELELAHEVLFSARRFKQRGARYSGAAGVAPALTPVPDSIRGLT